MDVHCYGHSLNAHSPSKWASFMGNRNVVFRIFTYRHNASCFGEIDLFQTMSSQSDDGSNAQFSVQKRKIKGNVKRIAVDFEDLKTLSVAMDWAQNEIRWTATDKERDRVIAEWTYSDSENIPIPSDELFLHFNLWSRGGPADGKLRHVAVSNVVYTPVSEFTE